MKFKPKTVSQSIKLTLIFIIGFNLNAFSQVEDAWVYFNDKPGSDEGINNPILILTQKAIDRKQRHNVSIDFRDVPVDQDYITTVKTQNGVTVLAKSKWFNSVYVRGNESSIRNLSNLSMVSEVVFADRRLNTLTAGVTRTTFPPTTANKFDHEVQLVDFDYGAASNQIEMMNADELHRKNYTGEGMTIAVMDSGFPNVDTNPAFSRLRANGKLKGGYDFVDRTAEVFAFRGSTHGATVLSDMAGFLQNQFVGTAPDANYYVFRTEKSDDETPLEESLWVEAAERADSLGVDVINTSLGYSAYDNPNYSYGPQDLNGVTAFISRGATMAFDKGMLVVTSAGNSGASGLGVPGDSPGALTIGAVRSNGAYASFSSRGTSVQPTQKPDVVAQGQSSAVIGTNGRVSTASGTSFSSPIMAGAVACLWQALPTLNNAEIMQIIRESSSQFDNPDFLLGYGIPDFKAILDQTLSNDDIENPNGQIKVFPNPATDKINIKLPNETVTAELELFDVLGQKVLDKSITQNNSFIETTILSKGVYFMKFKMENSNKTIKVILK